MRNSETAYVDCVAGAAPRQEYLDTIKAAGFQEIEILNTAGDPEAKGDQSSGSLPIASITIRAVKPRD